MKAIVKERNNLHIVDTLNSKQTNTPTPKDEKKKKITHTEFTHTHAHRTSEAT